VLEANTSDDASLQRMASQAVVCINAVGPFRFHGRQVVRACIEAGCSYLDICGEPEFIEAVAYEYDDLARERGVHVASACGFDSVPVDVGNALVVKAFPPRCCCSVETYIELRSGPSGAALHFPTYASAVHGLGSVQELRRLRTAAAAKRKEREGERVGKSAFPVPMRAAGSYAEDVGMYVIPFIGADASVVKRTELANGFMPSSRVYMCLPSRYRFLQFALYGSLFKGLAKYAVGRRLLLSYPRVFCPIVSMEGPTSAQLRETSFKVTLVGSGFEGDEPVRGKEGERERPDKRVRLEISGPEPGYLTCSICIVSAARVLVRGELSGKAGGVHTPAGLLLTDEAGKETSFVHLMKQRGIVFDWVPVS